MIRLKNNHVHQLNSQKNTLSEILNNKVREYSLDKEKYMADTEDKINLILIQYNKVLETNNVRVVFQN